MKKENHFFGTVCKIAIPVTLQSMLQSSFSMVDQIMIGQLGSVSIAAIGLAGKFSSIFSVVVAAVGAVAGIMIAQYMGSHDEEETHKSFWVNLMAAILIAVIFMGLCVSIPVRIMGIYTEDLGTREVAAAYLKLIAMTFLPMAGATLLSTMLRCMERAALPLYASLASAVLNTGLNYIFIFGKCGFRAMGVQGAAIATVISQVVNFLIMLAAFLMLNRHKKFHFSLRLGKMSPKQYFVILLPILLNEFLWSLGENVYATIYGHLGTAACAAMTLTNPIQGFMIGALSGLSQAAGILIGKQLGKREYEKAYSDSVKLLLYGLCGAILLSAVLFALKGFYVNIYQVEDGVKETAKQILTAFALISPVKVLNMILGGGIIRSGGQTKIVLCIDLIGTWIFGVPLGFVTAFVMGLSIPYVYFILSLEEAVRLMISFVIFRRRKWMQSLS